MQASELAKRVKSNSAPTIKNTELVVTCEHGPRAVMAQRLFALYGYRNTTLLEGHMAGWKRDALPLE